MVDRLSPERRSKLMSRVAGKDTDPEMRVRRAAHAMGLRFRLHRKDLPGKPDLVFPKLQTIVFVHGCFWHRHPGCPKAGLPKTRIEYWKQKFDTNIARDKKNLEELECLGWAVKVIWECETNNEDYIRRFLSRLQNSDSYKDDH